MWTNTLARWGLIISSGLALALAFPKFDLSLLAWVAFVPLFYATAGEPPLKVFGYAFGQGFVSYLASLYWVIITLHNFAGLPVIVAIGPLIALASVLALYTGAAFAVAEYATTRLLLPRMLTAPIAWTAFEWLRSFFPIGFPWDLLGYAAYHNLQIIQFSEFTGVYGVSALIMFFNVVVFSAIGGEPSRRAQTWGLSALTAIMILAVTFGTLRIRQLEGLSDDGELKVAMAQGNIPQSIKWDPKALPTSFRVYENQSQLAAREHADLTIWPEAAAAFIFQPNDLYPAEMATDAQYRARLLNLARSTGQPILFGAPALRLDHGEVGTYNRAYLVSAQGNIEGYYDKIKLVPFGEYVPFRSLLGFFVDRIVVGFGDMVPGVAQTLFKVRGTVLGVLICYESIFPDLSRRAVKNGANVLVNITNDAWYGESSAPFQLLAMAAMRAVESHVPMVRVANTGISAVITATGRITARTDLFTREMEIERVGWRRNRTVYDLVGNLFCEICFALIIAALACAFFFPRKPRTGVNFNPGIITSNGHP